MILSAALLFGLAVPLLAVGAGDLVRFTPRKATPATRRTREIPGAAVSLGLPARLRRAGKEGEITSRSVLYLKALSSGTGLMFGLTSATALPGRIGPLVLAAAALGGFFVPDLLLERVARTRHRRMVAALPDALDLLSVSVATGKSLGAAFAELGRSARGPLAAELARAGEDMAWGSGQAAALETLRERVSGREIAALCATLERSRKLGSPLADQLRRQSAGLRRDQRRAIEDEAARAAPKIQLVIALVLVPSVLLLIVAALVANSDRLLGAGM
ncbi:MAG TPA: type II secretion system F family protein [Solirubrobacterales bacterium]|nr:type II secretion system F family protein [Solirubrobacterales bacterium]